MSMLRNLSRRYAPESQPEVTKPVDAKAVGAANPKRRALGDITNAYSQEESKDSNNAAKKPIFTSSESSNPNTARSVGDPERDYMNRESDDIDARDAGNPLLATCYVNDMYKNFGQLERQYAVNPNYMTNQPYVNERMRSILVDWLVSFCLHTALHLFDSIHLIFPYFINTPLCLSRLKCISNSRWFLNPSI